MTVAPEKGALEKNRSSISGSVASRLVDQQTQQGGHGDGDDRPQLDRAPVQAEDSTMAYVSVLSITMTSS